MVNKSWIKSDVNDLGTARATDGIQCQWKYRFSVSFEIDWDKMEWSECKMFGWHGADFFS